MAVLRLFRIDPLLAVAPLVLVTLGILLLYSVTHSQETGTLVAGAPGRQALYALAGFTCMLVIARIDYRLLMNISLVLYLGVMALLGLVLVIGGPGSGIKRWIDLGILQLQPSELMKLVVVIILAHFFARFKEQAQSIKIIAGSLLLTAVPMAIVYLQPDLGTTLVFGCIWLGMAIMGGVRPLYLGVLGLGGILMAPIGYLFLLQPYMQHRLLQHLDPYSDPLGSGYNVLQSEISVGSGGFLGKGLFNGTQSQLHFLRVQQTDFIFSVLGEELGFVGGMLVFGLFLILLLRALSVAAQARDDFGRFLAVGVVMMMLTQVFFNVGVSIRLLPVTGIPLPFVSFGGSSLLTMMLALGVLQSVHLHHKRAEW